MENNLAIIPVINKIDLQTADVDRVIEQIDAELGLDPFSHLKCSAKEGIGIEEILEAIVKESLLPKEILKRHWLLSFSMPSTIPLGEQ